MMDGSGLHTSQTVFWIKIPETSSKSTPSSLLIKVNPKNTGWAVVGSALQLPFWEKIFRCDTLF